MCFLPVLKTCVDFFFLLGFVVTGGMVVRRATFQARFALIFFFFTTKQHITKLLCVYNMCHRVSYMCFFIFFVLIRHPVHAPASQHLLGLYCYEANAFSSYKRLSSPLSFYHNWPYLLRKPLMKTSSLRLELPGGTCHQILSCRFRRAGKLLFV